VHFSLWSKIIKSQISNVIASVAILALARSASEQSSVRLRFSAEIQRGDCFVGLGLDMPLRGYSTTSPPRNDIKWEQENKWQTRSSW
jgi:hypothetical protein